MRIDTYEFETRPSKRYSSPERSGRIAAEPSYGGAVTHSSAGHLSDSILTLPFDGLSAAPSEDTVQVVAAADTVAGSVGTGGALAVPVPVAAGDFAAISAIVLRMRNPGGATGLLSFEVWDSLGAEPAVKVGLLGVLDAAEIGAVWETVEIWSDVAWPLLTPGGFVVLNGAGLTAGPIVLHWGGNPAPANAHYEYSPVTDSWSLANGELGSTIYQGSMFLILRGFAGAYCYPGGPGPASRVLELDDSHRYNVRILGLAHSHHVPPLEMTSNGLAQRVKLHMLIESEAGDQALGS